MNSSAEHRPLSLSKVIDVFLDYFQRLSHQQIALVLFCMAGLIYGNSLLNEFVADDIGLIETNVQIHSLSSIPEMFVQGLSPEDSVPANNYYRPLFSVTSAIVYFLSVGEPDGFHVVQVAIHSINAFLMFLILTFFFSRGIAFFVSLVFLVHPINTEAVVYIASLQEPLFLLFGLGVIYLTLKKPTNMYVFFIVGLLELLALLSKETAIAFLFLIPAVHYLFQKNKLFLFHVIMSISVLLMYLVLRFAVAGVYFNQFVVVPITTLSLGERLMHIPKIIFFYLKTFFYPKTLAVFQSWTVESLNLADFYLPSVFVLTFFALLFWFGFILHKSNKPRFKIFLLFLAWFIVGLGIHIQIFPLDQTVADRYFYFPIIGLLGMIGLALTHFKIPSGWGLSAIAAAAVLVVVLSGRVIVRNTDWKTPATLYRHDIAINKDSYQLERALGGVVYQEGDINQAERHFIRATELFPSQRSFSMLCNFYLQHNLEKSVETCQAALDHSPDLAMSWANVAVAQYKTGDKQNALAAARKAQELSPSSTYASLIRTIENNAPLRINITIR